MSLLLTSPWRSVCVHLRHNAHTKSDFAGGCYVYHRADCITLGTGRISKANLGTNLIAFQVGDIEDLNISI